VSDEIDHTKVEIFARALSHWRDEDDMVANRKATRGEYALVNAETGERLPFDTLPLDEGDLLIFRSNPPMPADEAQQLRELVQARTGKKILVGSGPLDWSWELMGRVQQEALLARLQEHLKQTWPASETHN